jgi:hypothetical protein
MATFALGEDSAPRSVEFDLGDGLLLGARGGRVMHQATVELIPRTPFDFDRTVARTIRAYARN